MNIKRKKGRPPNNRPKDHSFPKKKPNSFVALFKAVRTQWGILQKDDKAGRSKETFAESMRDDFNNTKLKYPGAADITAVSSWLTRLESTSGKDTNEITYFHIRVFAEYCRIPCNLLMVYSHVCALVRKSEQEKIGKDFALCFLDRIISSLLHLKNRLEDTLSESSMKDVLISNDSDRLSSEESECPYDVKIDVLEEMQREFWNAGEKARVEDAKFHDFIKGNF